MFRYTAYGLHIESTLALPELIADSQTEPDVNIRCGSLGWEVPVEPGAITCLKAAVQEVYLAWGRIAALLVKDGREITIDPFPGVDERTLRLFILGAALGVLLHQRHQLVLHASAVVLDKQVVAFIGDKGWGKSTTAAALHARGHWLVADDVVAIVTRDNFPVVLPGYPQVKLWSESAEALGVNPQTLSPIREGIDKYAQTTRERFTDTALPLGAVYVLGSGDELAIEPLPPPVALLQLIRNQYIAGLGTSYAQATQDDTSFLQCADVAKRVPVRLLRRPYDLASLTRLAELIEIDMRQFQPV